jgi:hypothetical protein
MSIAVQVHDNDPRALADLISETIHDGIVIGREPTVAHLSLLVHEEERDVRRRRAAWAWLNSFSRVVDAENDWSDV